MNVRIVASVLVALTAACQSPAPPAPEPPPPAPKPKFVYGVAMHMGAAFEAERARATREFLEKALDAEITPRLYGYDELAAGLVEGTVDIAFSTPLVYVRAAKQNARLGLLRQALHGGKPGYRSVFFVRRDSGFQTIQDLAGRKVAFVKEGSASGNLFPRAHLLGKGYDPTTFFGQISQLANHATVCDAVYAGDVQVGASFTNADGDVSAMTLDACLPSLGDKAQDLRVIFASEPIPNDVVVVRAGFPQELADKLGAALDELDGSEGGRKVLASAFASDGFVPAHDASFGVVRQAIELLPADAR